MKAVIALGSNLGDRRTHLDAGLAGLRTLGVVLPSPLVMETPDESGRGPAYLNTVALLVTEEADPRHLLEDKAERLGVPLVLAPDGSSLVTEVGPPPLGEMTWRLWNLAAAQSSTELTASTLPAADQPAFVARPEGPLR